MTSVRKTIGSYRQETIIDYIVEKESEGRSSKEDRYNGFTTREIANALNVTTGAVLSACKRLRAKGRLFDYDNKWWLSSSERFNRVPTQ